MQAHPVVLSNNDVVVIQIPEKVNTINQASKALQLPYEAEMRARIDAKLLREQIEEAQSRLAQLELDVEVASKEFKLVEKMVAASGFRPMRPSVEDGIFIPYAVQEDLDKGILVASMNGTKGLNAVVLGG